MEVKIQKIIKQKREERQMLQEDLAKLLGVSPAAVSSWERGRTEPNMGMVAKMCEIFNCTTSELVYGTDSPSVVNHSVGLTNEEKYLIEIYRKADNSARYSALQQLMNAQKGER